MRKSTRTTAFCWNSLILCLHNINTLNIYMKKFDAKKINLWQNDSFVNLDNFLHFLVKCGFCFFSLISLKGNDGISSNFANTLIGNWRKLQTKSWNSSPTRYYACLKDHKVHNLKISFLWDNSFLFARWPREDWWSDHRGAEREAD